MQTNQLSIKNSIKFAFVGLWQNKVFYLKLLLLNLLLLASCLGCSIVMGFLGFGVTGFREKNIAWYETTLSLLFYYAGFLFLAFCIVVVLYGFTKIALELYDSGKSSLKTYFSGMRYLKKLLIPCMATAFIFPASCLGLALYKISIISGLFRLLGHDLAVIMVKWMYPHTFVGIVLGLVVAFVMIPFAFYWQVLADVHSNVLRDINTSFQLTKGNRFKLYFLMAPHFIVYISAALLWPFPIFLVAFFLYLFLVMPLVILIFTHTYRTLQGRPRSSIAPLQTNV